MVTSYLVVVSNPDWSPDCNLGSRAVMIEDGRVPIVIAVIPNENVAKHPREWRVGKKLKN